MPLQVWLPLTKDLSNQGLTTASPAFNDTNSSIVINGKLGSCLKTTDIGDIDINCPFDINVTSISFGGWLKFNKEEIQAVIDTKTYSSSSSSSSGSIIGNSNYGGIGIVFRTNDLYSTEKVLSSITLVGHIRSTEIGSIATDAYTIPWDEWIHVMLVMNRNTLTLSMYINGELYNAKSINNFTDASTHSIMINFAHIASGNGVRTAIPFRANDLRFYDHALSAKEVKEISKGLVAHYQLNDIYSTDNLIINGYGQDGGAGWTNTSYYSTTEIPPDHPEIKASFHSNTQSPLTPWDSSHTYTISAYLKAKDSGTSYPAFTPYDIDKKYIQYFHCSMAFSNSYRTTLAQPLHKGDTVIYATDLSAWTTGDNYYYHVAIFGYKDSTGYVYPDLQYTQDSPTFGTKTDKSHIDKTNNTITLNSAYTGEDRPAGTTICQATEGNTYFYPFGGINTSTIQDWTYKTATITPQLDGRLRFAKYIRYMAYYYAYHAGIQLVDNTAGTDIVYDSSGYNYHGQINTDMSISSNTSRNQLATSFDGVGNCITIPFNEMLGVTEATKKDYTVSVWTYKEVIGSKSYQTILGGPSGFELEARSSTSTNPLYRLYNWGGGTTAYEFNKWNHFCFVHTSDDAKLYVNGELKITGTSANIPVGNFFIGAWKTATQQNFDGRMSDFRIYATALSTEDIQQLYNAPVSISNNGAMFTQGEFVES